MKTFIRFTLLLAVGATAAFAQTGPPSPAPKADVVMVSLVGATYPPLARQARIAGDVELKLEIRKDGSIQSAVAVSGHPMLTQAALNSAQQSQFECRGCEHDVTPYSLIYSFQLATDDPEVPVSTDPCPKKSEPRITQSQNRVIITTVERGMISIYFSSVRMRSAKCAYLWACSTRWGGEDYYYYRVRSAKCLGLWECGHRLREPFATWKKFHCKVD